MFYKPCFLETQTVCWSLSSRVSESENLLVRTLSTSLTSPTRGAELPIERADWLLAHCGKFREVSTKEQVLHKTLQSVVFC